MTTHLANDNTAAGTDARTEEVRSFYEQFPYPSERSPMLRSGFDARLVSSLGHLARPEPGGHRILDAGCGRGVGLVTCGTLHPRASVLGIDLCRASLADAQAEIERRGLTNTRVQEVDLMTLEGLEVPEGGFDLIYSSGVVHHLSDPATGLRRLAEALAPSGVVIFMVYGSIGRRNILRVSRALAAWLEPELELPQKLAQARHLVEELSRDAVEGCPWREAAATPDAEFVDRYLHPLETDYDVPGLFDLVEDAGLRFLRWCSPEQWSLEGRMPEGPLRDSIEALPERERYAMIEQIVRPKNLQAYLCRPENGPRRLPPLEQWGSMVFAVQPEVHFEVGRRNLWCDTRIETIAYCKRAMERVDLDPGALHHAGWILSTQNEPFHGETLVSSLVEAGYSRAQGFTTLAELVRLELIYAPHAVELH